MLYTQCCILYCICTRRVRANIFNDPTVHRTRFVVFIMKVVITDYKIQNNIRTFIYKYLGTWYIIIYRCKLYYYYSVCVDYRRVVTLATCLLCKRGERLNLYILWEEVLNTISLMHFRYDRWLWGLNSS